MINKTERIPKIYLLEFLRGRMLLLLLFLVIFSQSFGQELFEDFLNKMKYVKLKEFYITDTAILKYRQLIANKLKNLGYNENDYYLQTSEIKKNSFFFELPLMHIDGIKIEYKETMIENGIVTNTIGNMSGKDGTIIVYHFIFEWVTFFPYQ